MINARSLPTSLADPSVARHLLTADASFAGRRPARWPQRGALRHEVRLAAANPELTDSSTARAQPRRRDAIGRQGGSLNHGLSQQTFPPDDRCGRLGRSGGVRRGKRCGPRASWGRWKPGRQLKVAGFRARLCGFDVI